MKPLSDYSHIRGIHLSRSGVMPLEKQLEYCQKLNLNSCRAFGDYWMYEKDPEGTKARVLSNMRTCWQYGVSTMHILFGANSLKPEILEPAFWAEKVDAYVRDMVLLLKDEPGLLMWDIMNEPSCNLYLRNAPEGEKEARWAKINACLEHFCQLVKELDPEGCITIGHTEACDLEPSSAWVDVITFHDYRETRARIAENYDLAEEVGRKYGKPVINSETCCLCRANPYDVELEMCRKYNVGYYLFELMVEPKGRIWSRVHGIFYPDGTVRDPSIVAGIMGCFRNRSETFIYPDVNMEGHGDKAIAFAKEALDRRAPQEDLLEAAEYIANLLESGELVPMAYPPTAKIFAWRRNPADDVNEVRAFLYDLIEKLRKACEIV